MIPCNTACIYPSSCIVLLTIIQLIWLLYYVCKQFATLFSHLIFSTWCCLSRFVNSSLKRNLCSILNIVVSYSRFGSVHNIEIFQPFVLL
jgi:hypothetical protein